MRRPSKLLKIRVDSLQSYFPTSSPAQIANLHLSAERRKRRRGGLLIITLLSFPLFKGERIKRRRLKWKIEQT